MSREIKFRAWDIQKKIMIDIEDVKFNYMRNTEPVGYDNEGIGGLQGLHILLEQYTGLKDGTKWDDLTLGEQTDWARAGKKAEDWNGKEIYEGDKVYWDELKKTYPIIFQDGAFRIGTGEKIYNLLIVDVADVVEVVGNIHDEARLTCPEGE